MLTPEQIRDARQRAGYSQAVLGKLVGVSGRTVGNWERGETSPISYASKIRTVLREHLDEAGSEPTRSLLGASDAELLAEIARRFSRTLEVNDDDYDTAEIHVMRNGRMHKVETADRSDALEEQKIAARNQPDPNISMTDEPTDGP